MNKLANFFVSSILLLVSLILVVNKYSANSQTREIPKDYFSAGLSDIIARNYNQAINDFTTAANQGNADAAFNLGLMYYYSQGAPVSYSISTRWMLKAAEEGNIRAEYTLVAVYQNGTGVPIDYSQSNFWQEKVQARGYDDKFELAEMYDAGDDSPGSYDNFSVDQAVLAISWTRMAAESGDPVSEGALADNYDYGGGFPEDDTQAVLWNTKAAEQGFVDAEFNLGSAYDTGFGVPKDLVKAYFWYDLVAIQGDEIAISACAELAKEMSRNRLAQAKEMVKNFRPS